MSKMRDADMPLVERIGAAIERIAHGQAAMRVPVEATDPDVVLADCQREIERLRAERAELRDVLLRNGFVPCDIPACNCGSWHHRYGLPERMQEIKDALAEAGHELSNANGNLTLNALKALVAERDELRRQLTEAGQDAIYNVSVKLRNNRTLTIEDLRVLADTLEEIVWNALHGERRTCA